MTIKIAPSILAADFAKLGSEVERLCIAGADLIHIDVMDGRFVPNLTFGPSIISALKPYSSVPFEVHLMVEKPENHIEQFAKAGAEYITFHYEATLHVERVVQQIKQLGVKVGISLLPTTPASMLEYIISELDLVLVMSVNPGFGGQKFLPSQLPKITKLRQMINDSNKKILLGVDGGVNEHTAGDILKAGAKMLVTGSYLFNHPSLPEAMLNLRCQE